MIELICLHKTTLLDLTKLGTITYVTMTTFVYFSSVYLLFLQVMHVPGVPVISTV